MRTSLWQELRRRRVFRTAGLYVVGAWLVIQVADIFFPAWALPETAIRYLFIAATACFPVALVFGWFYDVTSGGIVRTRPADEATGVDLGLKKLDYVVLAALFAIGAAILAGSVEKIQREVVATPDLAGKVEKAANSIAVLPFTNLDENRDTRFFSDGVTEEILHRLATLGPLHVLASTSSFAFRDTDEGPAGISDKLGVRYLLQGSVRRDQDYVRVTARLVDESGFQLWSETFDRKLESIFVIQSEIASAVSAQIVNEIVPPQELPPGRTTDSTEAYTAYLRGRAYFDTRSWGWKEKAEAAFRHAIELDPGYAPPYAGLATLVVNTRQRSGWEDARRSAEKALELDPQLPIAHAVLGLTRTALGEFEQGLESLQKAVELNPSLSIAYGWMTLPLAAMGRDREASDVLRRGLEVDPLNPVVLKNLSDLESLEGHFDQAEQLLLRLTDVPDPPGMTYGWLQQLYDRWSRYDAAVEAGKEFIRQALRDGAEPDLARLAGTYARLGLKDESAYWYEQARAGSVSGEPPIDSTFFLASLDVRQFLAEDLQRAEAMLTREAQAESSDIDTLFLRFFGGLAHIQAGNFVEGNDWLERSLAMYQEESDSYDPTSGIDYGQLERDWPTRFVVILAQHRIYACRESGCESGEAAALTGLQEIVGVNPERSDPWVYEWRALAGALSGDADAARSNLREALNLGWANYYQAVNDATWRPLVSTPGVDALLAEAKENVDVQRAAVVARDSEQDFRAEVEELMELAARH